MPLQATSGAASYDAFGGGVPVEPNYIESCFSTYLYTGTGAAQTITNGIGLSTKGGLVWLKDRLAGNSHQLADTVRGNTNYISSNTAAAQQTSTTDITSFNATGFTMGTGATLAMNDPGNTYVSWTFRKQPKFFDVVTYTGDGNSNRAVSHNLSSVPACILLKRTDSATSWFVYHRSTGGTPQNNILQLNTTDAVATSSGYWGTTPFTDTEFRVSSYGGFNASGGTYVAYLFAHNAGGFGLTGTDNVISCGSYTGNGSNDGPTITLGYEPQWLLIKDSTTAKNWQIFDNMRGMVVGLYNSDSDDAALQPNLSNAESLLNGPRPNATGFSVGGSAQINTGASTYIYIAIRRGPMKVPTVGTSVFYPTAWTGSMSTRNTTTGFVTDLNISRMRQNFSSGSNLGAYWETRLTGATNYLHSDAIAAEATQTDGLTSFASNTGITFGDDSIVQAWNYDNNYRNWSFKRAPSYMDVVCYTGTGSTPQTIAHNLGVAPELMIIKGRSLASSSWIVYAQPIWGTGIGGFSGFDLLQLNNNGNAGGNNKQINETAPTASVFSVGYSGITFPNTNNSGDTFVAYLFATCAGVSKIGKYIGNGSSQTINCGFTAGARFVMVKAASTTGNWICVDTNGINPTVDRALYMNNADVEDFTYDWIDIDSTGFIVNETSTIAANTNGVTYIFLAIA